MKVTKLYIGTAGYKCEKFDIEKLKIQQINKKNNVSMNLTNLDVKSNGCQ